MINRLLAVLFLGFALMCPLQALAQTSCEPGGPNIFQFGVVPTPGQWAQCLQSKQDVLGYNPLNQAGGTMTGKLNLATSSTIQAGLNCGAGSAPTTPKNGDVWCTTSGVYAQLNGQTVGPLVSAQSAEIGSTLLNVITASNSANISDLTSLTSGYDDYELVLDNIVPATASVSLELLVYSGGYQNSGYLNTGTGVSTYLDLLGGGASSLDSTAGYGYSGTVRIHNVNSSAYKLARGTGTFYTGSALATSTVSGAWGGATTPVTGFRILMSSGNITSGSIKVYGLRKAL